jgi:hypothetical protein
MPLNPGAEAVTGIWYTRPGKGGPASRSETVATGTTVPLGGGRGEQKLAARPALGPAVQENWQSRKIRIHRRMRGIVLNYPGPLRLATHEAGKWQLCGQTV